MLPRRPFPALIGRFYGPRAPEYLRSDNGSEFIAHTVQCWLAEQRIHTIYIDPGSPWQNGFVESFHGRFCDECLNREQLWPLSEARVAIEDFRQQYNTRRLHSKLHYQSSAHFAAQLTPSLAPVGLRPPSAKDGQTPPITQPHHFQTDSSPAPIR